MKPKNPHIICADGTRISVQADEYMYCTPRDNDGPYTHVECGFPSVAPTGRLLEYIEDPSDPCGTVYAYVPIDVVEEFLAEHGGIAEGKLP